MCIGKIKQVAFIIIFYSSFANMFAQDTLRLNIDSVEHLFLRNNLILISQKYQIEEARAAIIQAKLFENPTVYYENYIATPLKGEYFAPNVSSESYFQFQQLFYLAGKRQKRANIEKINTQIAEFEYYNLLRTLRNELYISFYELDFSIQSLKIYNKQLVSAKQIADAMDEQVKKGNVSLKEVTRIKALIFSLENNKLDIINSIQDKQSSLRTLTRSGVQTFILPVTDENKIESLTASNLVLKDLMSNADSSRFDLKEYGLAIQREEVNYKLQKALAVPDLTLGTTYDQTGNFIRNYTAIGVGIPLPLWNRNQGNIKIAKNLIEERKAEYDEKKDEVYNEIATYYAKAIASDKLYKSFDKSFTQDYERLNNGITQEYQKRNISLLEFLDYYETYTESMSQLVSLRSKRIEALEGLNLAVGTNVIK